MHDDNDYLGICEQAVRAGGQVLRQWAGQTNVRQKAPKELVTEADLASQETIRRIVLGAFPDHSFLGEESSPAERQAPRAPYRWIVDPLDGTTNYVHGIPHYCVSLGLERDGELLVGAVFDPILDECFTAVAGQGARLNGKPIHPQSDVEMSDVLAAVGLPTETPEESSDLKLFLAMLTQCQAIRRTGSAALNLCYLAAGRFDIFWSYATHSWDVAAGVLIVREAGGCVTSPTGGPFSIDEAHFLAAANPKLHAQLREIAARATGI